MKNLLLIIDDEPDACEGVFGVLGSIAAGMVVKETRTL